MDIDNIAQVKATTAASIPTIAAQEVAGLFLSSFFDT